MTKIDVKSQELMRKLVQMSFETLRKLLQDKKYGAK